jgi:hypothetical protein
MTQPTLVVRKLNTYADPAYATTPPTTNPTKESKMTSHNYSGCSEASQGTRFVPHIGAVGGPLLLKALEGLGLLTHAPTLHTLVASGHATVSDLGAQWTVHQVDKALSDTETTSLQRMTFKNVLDRHGLLKKNLY